MQGNYRLIGNGQHIGDFKIDSRNNIFIYKAFAPLNEQPLLFKKALSNSSVIEGDIVQTWLTTRAPEPNYEFIDALLEKVGITEYDPFAFVEYNSGKFNTDYFYLEQY